MTIDAKFGVSEELADWSAMHPLNNSSLGLVLGVLGSIAVAGGLGYFFYCPCERTPGGWLLDEAVVEPVSD